MNLAAAGSAVSMLVVAPVLGLVVLVGGGASSGAAEPGVCATTGPVVGLDAEQASNARLIVAVIQTVIAHIDPTAVEPASLIALMTAYQESTLRDLANPNVAGSGSQPGASGTGSDHDSVGLFQQRASWGTGAQRMDPVWATTAFLSRLMALPGWQAMPPGDAAQAVQGSKYPKAYAQWENAAHSWLAIINHAPLSGTGAPSGCDGSGIAIAGPAHLPPGFTLPADLSSAAAQAVTFALAQLGKPYVYSAAGPDAFDCSGLTMAAWAAASVTLPHNAAAQSLLGTAVAAPALLQPGDLVFIPGSDGTMQAPGHVGMYIGSGLIIEAPQTGETIKLVTFASFKPIAALRHYG